MNDEPHAVVWVSDDVVTKTNRRAIAVPLAGRTTRIEVAHAAAKEAGLEGELIVLRDGEEVGPNDVCHWGDTLHVAPRPGASTEVVVLSIALAVLSGSASYAVSSLLTPELPDTSGTPLEERYTFGQVQSEAFAGDTMPIVFGHLPRYGGKEISRLPGEGPNGDQILRMLIHLGHGPIRSVGSLEQDVTWIDSESTVDAFGNQVSGEVTGIFLNDQDVSNFTGAKISVRMGTDDQTAIPGFNDVEIIREVGGGGLGLDNSSGFPVTNDEPQGQEQTFTTIDPVDAAVLRVVFRRGLYAISGNGQFDPAIIDLRYRYRLADAGGGTPGPWSGWFDWRIERALQSEFTAAQRIDGLNDGGSQRYEIMLERVSPTPQGAAVVADATWFSVTEVVYSNERYPGQALLALELTAGDQLQGVPDVSVDIRGYADLAIWDGVSDPLDPVYVRGYSANPAWIARELLTNTTWGAGAIYADWIADAESELVDMARYADELVPRADGSGDRRRFEYNRAFDDAALIEDRLREICAAARCVPVQIGRSWRFPVDRPKPVAAETITDATIAVDDEGIARFTYSRRFTERGIDLPNRVVGQFSNGLAQGRSDVAGWPALATNWLATEQLNERQVQLRGITDPDQVLSQLKYLMKSERFRTRRLTLVHTAEILACTPGDRVDVSMSLPGYGLASGHVRAGSTSSRVLLDRTLSFQAGETYDLRIVHTDGTAELVSIGEPGAVDVAPADGLDLGTPLAKSPSEGAQYVVGRSGLDVKPFLVEAIRPVDSGQLRWELELIEYDDEIYDDAAETVEYPDYSDLRDPRVPPGPVINLDCFEVTTGVGRHFRLSWNQLPRDKELTATFRVFRRRFGQSAWVLIPNAVISNHSAILAEIDDADAGFEFRVVAVSVAGSFLSPNDPRHPTCTGVFNLGQQPPPPPAFAELIQKLDNTYTLRWNAVEEATGYQVLAGGDPSSTKPNTGAEDCLVVARTQATELTGLELAPGQPAEFWIRSSIDSGRLSVWTRDHKAAAQASVATAATPAGQSIRTTRVFDLSAEGTLSNAVYNATDTRLEMDNPAADAVWTSPEIDLGSAIDSGMTVRLETANDADDPQFRDAIFRVPSIDADQWGIVSPVLVMITPPYPDTEQTWLIEARTHDGASWTPWSALGAFAERSAAIQKYQIRVTMSRLSFPYRPALRGLTVVITS